MPGETKKPPLKEEDIVDTLNNFLFSRFENIHTCLPAQVESYTESERKAKIKVLINLVRKNGDILEVPIIDNVPVQFPSSSAFSLTFPLSKGDLGLVMFAEAGIGGYLSGTGTETEADSPARFQLTDAVFIPGVSPFRAVPNSDNIITVDSNNVMTIKVKEGSEVKLDGTGIIKDKAGSEIELDGAGVISIGGASGGSLEKIVLGETLQSAIDSLVNHLIIAVTATAVGPASFDPTTVANLTADLASFASALILSNGVKAN